MNSVNTFVPITAEVPSQEDNEVASITGSTRLYDHFLGTGSGAASGSGLQSAHSAFSIYLRDSRAQPCELYIPDGSANTFTSRTSNRYGHLKNGHEASLVRIETFIPYFGTDMYMIDINNLELLALQAGTTPLLVDAAKMLSQTATNAHQVALQNRSHSHSASRSDSRSSSRASARGPSHNSHYRTPHDPFWVNMEDMTLEATLHISINPSSMDEPADGAIFEANHLAEIADIRSKLV